MNWVNCDLGDVLTLKRGYDLPNDKRIEGETPVVSSSGVIGFHNESKVSAPAVVTGRYGTLGEVYFVDTDCWPLNTALYVKDFKGNRPRFIYYFLQNILSGMQSDKAAVPGVNRNDLHARKVKFPKDENLQKKIEELVTPYDDLIENNRRRIQLLEDSARLLYREWFVLLRFPGHEHVKIVEGVPEGWSRKKLIEIADITMGQSPKSEFYNENGNGLPFHQGVTNYGFRFVEHTTYCTMPTRLAEPFDILCSVRAPVGRINITLDRIILGRGLAAIRSKENNQSFLFFSLKSYFIVEDIIGSGSIYASVTKKDTENIEILIPQKYLIDQFEDVSKKIDKQIINLSKQNSQLVKARDLLLPRLMSGEISA